jgi:broad specificity phosphatase PhoE
VRSTASDSEKAIVCVRHGGTVWKIESRTQGQLDSPLSDIGVLQVHELATKLASESFGIILSSSLGRALQTARILSRQLGVTDVRRSDNLIERCEGVFQGLTRAQQAEGFPECFDSETDQVTSDLIPGVEPETDFLGRVAHGLREIERLAQTTSILVVTHTGVLQAMTSLVSGEEFVEVSATQSFGFCDVLRFHSDACSPFRLRV